MAEEKNLKSIFLAVLELPPDQRPAFLDKETAGDAELRKRVEALLHAHDEPDTFLQPLAEVAAMNVLSSAPLTESAGTVIGPYKLLQQIGEGGMGAVFMAQQQHPVQRQVALKIIKPGMDSRQVIARLETERQALALMDHPNIAKVLDAGATSTGRPYFAMELVKGVPITKYCDEHHLDPAQRLELFIPVCRAVQHAHQKGIIHRDIKPSNVLVALYDGRPVPKVIDFGIAKALGQRLTDRTMFTEFGQVVGTLEYMSPEQAELNQLDVDTRSDVYSLGVLLYELLTGSTPLERKRLLESAFDEILRVIREEDPPKPSTRLSSTDQLATVAADRHTEPRKLSNMMRGELDWIVMKSLEKDRNRRYETANGLAEDIQRYLSDEAVQACPPSAIYRIRKLARRHRLAMLTSAIVAAALLLGGIVSTWQAIRATRSERAQFRLREEAEAAQASEAKLRVQAEENERKAVTEAAKSQQVAAFMKDMLKGVAPSVALGRDTKMLREILDQTSQRLNDLADQPAVEADLRATLGDVFLDLSSFSSAVAMHQRALELRKSLFGEEHPDVARSLDDLGHALNGLGNYAEAESMHRAALAMRTKLLGEDSAATAESLSSLASDIWRQGLPRHPESEAMYRKALAIQRKLPGGPDENMANTLHGLANVLHSEGVNSTGLEKRSKLAEAVSLQREALTIEREHLGKEHPQVAASLQDLGWLLRFEGKYADSEAMEREALEMERKLFGSDNINTAAILWLLGSAQEGQKKYAEAEASLRDAMALYGKLGIRNTYSDLAQEHLANVLDRQEKFPEAEASEREHLAQLRTRFKADDPRLASTLCQLAVTLMAEKKLSEAESIARDSLSIYDSKQPDDWHAFGARSLLGGIFLKQEKYAEAEPLLLAGYQGLNDRQEQLREVDKPRLREAMERLANLYDATNRSDTATKWKEKIVEFDQGTPKSD